MPNLTLTPNPNLNPLSATELPSKCPVFFFFWLKFAESHAQKVSYETYLHVAMSLYTSSSAHVQSGALKETALLEVNKGNYAAHGRSCWVDCTQECNHWWLLVASWIYLTGLSNQDYESIVVPW